MKKIIYLFLCFIAVILATLTLCFNFHTCRLRTIANQSIITITPTPTLARPANLDKNCELVKIDSARTMFCLNKKMVGDYEIQTFDQRQADVNKANRVTTMIKTKDFKESGEIIPGTASWKNHRVDKGISVNLVINFKSNFMNYDELARYYSEPYFEEHNEFPPRKGSKLGKAGKIQYVYEQKIKDKDSYSKGYEIDSHFLNGSRQYDLNIAASSNSISEKDFMDLHEYILNSLIQK